MSRWRAPVAASTNLVTAEGLRQLQHELNELWKVRRPEVVAAITAAAAEGDRSENAEYIYRKKQLAEIDRRVRYLSKRIPSLRVAQGRPGDGCRDLFRRMVQCRGCGRRGTPLPHRRSRRNARGEWLDQHRFAVRHEPHSASAWTTSSRHGHPTESVVAWSRAVDYDDPP